MSFQTGQVCHGRNSDSTSLGERREGPSAATRHFSLPPTRGFAGYRAGPQWDSSTVAASQLLRPFPQFTGVTMGNASFFGASSYNAMQLKVEKRYSHGFNLLLAYTWSNLMDNIPASETGFPGGSFGGTGIQDWDNLRAEWEVASFDTPQYLAINGIYALPFGHGRRFFNHSRAADYIIGGWQLTGITSAESGTPQEVFAASNTLFKWRSVELNFLEARERFIPGVTVPGCVEFALSAGLNRSLSCLDVGQVPGGDRLNHGIPQR